MPRPKRNFDELRFWAIVVPVAVGLGAGAIALVANNEQGTVLQPQVGFADVNGKGVTINRCVALDANHPENVYTMNGPVKFSTVGHPEAQTGLEFKKLSHGESNDGFGLGAMKYGSQPVYLAMGQLATLKQKLDKGEAKFITGHYDNEEDNVDTECTIHATAANRIPDSIDGNAVRITLDPGDFGHVTGMEGPITSDTEFGDSFSHVTFK
jgi:hypothetical protein